MKDRELGAFANVDATDADDFIERLDRMHVFEGFRLYKAQSLQEMRLEPGYRVADVGCGAGDDAGRLAQIVGPEGRATGIDLSQAMVDEAARRFAGTANLDFVCASAESLPFPDDSFDAIRADRVLIHVPDPAAALAEMVRVTRPGGRIVISEPDMVGFWVAAKDWQTSEGVARAIAMSCAHPFLPREMPVMLRDLVLEEVTQASIAMVTDDFSVVDRVVQFEVVVKMLTASGKVDSDRLGAWWAEQRDRAATGRFCAGLNVYTVGATKPSGEARAIPLPPG